MELLPDQRSPTDLDVSVSPVDEPLVNLVAEAQRVVFDAQVRDRLQLLPGEDLQDEHSRDGGVSPVAPEARGSTACGRSPSL